MYILSLSLSPYTYIYIYIYMFVQGRASPERKNILGLLDPGFSSVWIRMSELAQRSATCVKPHT